MMNHQDIKDRLNDHVDGSLQDDERDQVESHLESCAECSLELRQLRSLLARAEDLPRAIEPPQNLWREIERQIQPATVVTVSPAQPSFASRFRQWILVGTLGAAAAAVVFVLTSTKDPVGGSGVANREASPSQSPASSDPDYVPSLVQALEYQCMGAGKQLLASTKETESQFVLAAATAFEADVHQLDLAISETRAALEENPQDAQLLRMLMSRYQRKLSVLHRATRFVEEA